MNTNTIWWIIIIILVLFGAYFLFVYRRPLEAPSAGFIEVPEVPPATLTPSVIEGSEPPGVRDTNNTPDDSDRAPIPVQE